MICLFLEIYTLPSPSARVARALRIRLSGGQSLENNRQIYLPLGTRIIGI